MRRRLGKRERAAAREVKERAAREGPRVRMRSAWSNEGIPVGTPSLPWEWDWKAKRRIDHAYKRA